MGGNYHLYCLSNAKCSYTPLVKKVQLLLKRLWSKGIYSLVYLKLNKYFQVRYLIAIVAAFLCLNFETSNTGNRFAIQKYNIHYTVRNYG